MLNTMEKNCRLVSLITAQLGLFHLSLSYCICSTLPTSGLALKDSNCTEHCFANTLLFGNDDGSIQPKDLTQHPPCT
eukprot:m.121491 g.121491  ORF g.121491 m.121491 type:complete len:77 (+) comp15640_c0_seq3:316-546(+)